MVQKRTREASHAGSWYEFRPAKLSSELDKYLSQVPDTINGKSLPIPGARAIIAPHAGYTYSGPCAAWAYKTLDLTGIKRVFLIGPSHKYYLTNCALSTCSKYETPFGDLTVDAAMCSELRETGDFSNIPFHKEVQEHCLEMHLPYLWKRLEQTFGDDASAYPLIVPIIVGVMGEAEEDHYGHLLAPYLKDSANACIISSDFCHWGSNYDYSPQYIDGVLKNPGHKSPSIIKVDLGFGVKPRPRVKAKPDPGLALDGTVEPNGTTNADVEEPEEPEVSPPPYHEIIKKLDEIAMDAVETGVHGNFHRCIKVTGNTVCGSHPIGVVMAALEALKAEGLEDGKGKFKFIQYQRSGLVVDKDDFSVSYAAAYAVI